MSRHNQRIIFLLSALCVLLCLKLVQAATLPSTLGWYDIPNTTFQTVQAPDYSGQTNIVAAWSSAAADPNNNRLLVFGGGHSDYYGNEVYELNLNTLSVSLLDKPSAIPSTYSTQPASCSETTPDGNPTSRHTYDGLTYLANVNKMFAYGGSLAPCGGMWSQYVWTFDPSIANPNSTQGWTNQNPTGGQPGEVYGASTIYDPNTGKIFTAALTSGGWMSLWTYSYASNAWTEVNGSLSVAPKGNLTAAIDPGRKMLFLAGGSNFYAVDISGNDPNYTIQDWSSQLSGCGTLLSVGAPGLAYDSVQKLIVGWVGGNTVYQFNPDTKTCSPVTYAGGPPPPIIPSDVGSTGQQKNGTYGRFAYFPRLNVFVVVNDWQADAYALRLSNGIPPPPPPPSACDVNGDGFTNVADVQKEVNMDLQIIPCTNPSGTCNVASVQKVVNAALGGPCVSP